MSGNTTEQAREKISGEEPIEVHTDKVGLPTRAILIAVIKRALPPAMDRV
jgi:hypothetical protein